MSALGRSGLLVLLTAAGLSSCSGPATFVCARYAAPDGADGAAGTRAAPFRTPQRLAGALRPGETGCLRSGSYGAGPDGYVLTLRASRISVRSAPGDRARLVGTVMIDRRASDVTLAHLDMVGTGGQNTVKVYGRDVVITDSEITNQRRGQSCVILGSTTGGRAVRPVVRRSVLSRCGAPADGNKDHGIYVARADGGQIVDNVFVDPAAYAIQLYPDAQGVYVARNVIDGGAGTVRGGIVIGGDARSASSANVVERNVITDTASAAVDAYWEAATGRGNVVRDNCTFRARGAVRGGGIDFDGNIEADPGFRDPQEGDYRLAPDGRCAEVVGFPGHSSRLGR